MANPNGVDLILMDIIMPHLDGVSATTYIRNIAPTVPIIAMTSNIRADDIDMYFRHGKTEPSTPKSTNFVERNERCPSEAVHQRRHASYTRKASRPI